MDQFSHGMVVGLIVRSSTIWRWQLQLIQSLIARNIISVREIIALDLPKIEQDKRIALLHRLDGKIFGSPVDAFDVHDASQLSENLISCDEFLRDKSVVSDALINLSESMPPIALIQRVALGVLQPVFSESGHLHSEAIGLRQHLDQQKQIYLSLTQLKPEGGQSILGEMRPSFEQGSFSRNLNSYWAWLGYLWERGLIKLAEQRDTDQRVSRPESVVSSEQSQRTSGTLAFQSNSQPLHHPLSLLDTAKGLVQLGVNMQRKLRQKYLHREQWGLLVKSLRHDSAVMGGQLDFKNFQEITPPSDCFWADPFVVSKDGRDYVFFEELLFATERGHLSCMELLADGSHTEPVRIIEEPHHLSYPNVFEHDDTFYLIPESGDQGSVGVYRCTEFPYQWVFHKTLIKDVHAYDSTLVEHDGRWWLFTTITPEPGLSECEELHIFYANSPMSEHWQPHPKNPVISDASCARPGGNFYQSDGQLYRVSQDCAGRYGAGINLSKVEQLTVNDYQESLVERYYPEWDKRLIALHTLNFNENFAVADALRVKTKGFLK
ncbi:MAG: hypothetical protein CSB47_09590 [Proteobacteria bacterium]|nr:MAG: hypothetical protein CSB47_09590 [Pseudomonadota bacterium]